MKQTVSDQITLDWYLSVTANIIVIIINKHLFDLKRESSVTVEYVTLIKWERSTALKGEAAHRSLHETGL